MTLSDYNGVIKKRARQKKRDLYGETQEERLKKELLEGAGI